MRKFGPCGLVLCLALLGGCVGKATYQAQVDEASALAAAVSDLRTQVEQLKIDRQGLREERSDLERKLAAALEDNSALNQDLLRARADLDRLENVLSARSAETGKALGEMRQTIDRLEAENRELSREIERERIAREARLAQMKNTYDQLVGKLESEIERGEITISDLQGQLTVNMVERILFDSGKADIKPAGLEVLARVGAILKDVSDKDIRVEGHTDNIPISSRLQDKFPSNWELSTARATNVVHFLQQRTGIAGERLLSCGFGPYRPVAANDTPEGRAENRRIQIVLVPSRAVSAAP